MKAVSAQPVSVAICASDAMQFYSSGVIAGEGSCTGLNHGVLAAGYDKARFPQSDTAHEMRGTLCLPKCHKDSAFPAFGPLLVHTLLKHLPLAGP